MAIIGAALSWLLECGITLHLSCCAFCGAGFAVAAVGLWHSRWWDRVVGVSFLIFLHDSRLG